MKDQEVRVRFAPSPTGEPHVGNIRTAIFNWLFARHHRGCFIIRIEDTDQTRKIEGAVEAILESLRWLGLDWDEGPEVGGPYGPYFQSERLDIYQSYVQRLLREGYAYICYCSPQRLEALRREQQQARLPPGYDGRCREIPEAERRRREREEGPPVVRFKVPQEGEAAFQDLIRGHVVFQNRFLDDFVVLKSDGYPTYHLANVVDDHLMRISHVLRAEEWLPSTPRHLLLYQALGLPPPRFAHLPMILGPDRSKLSKRHGATSCLTYRDQGYLPEAMLNFLSLLGWSLDDHTEVLDRELLVRHFSLERVTSAGAIFNQEKLQWMNGVYVRALPVPELARRVFPFLERDLPPEVQRPLQTSYVEQIIPLVQERLHTLGEAAELTSFFFLDRLEYDRALLVPKGLDVAQASAALQAVIEAASSLEAWTEEHLEAVLRALTERLGLKTGQLFGGIRVAVTGRTAAPPLFQTMAVLGRTRCLARLHRAVALLASKSGLRPSL